MTPHRRRQLLLIALLGGVVAVADAQEENDTWRLCPPPPAALAPLSTPPELPPGTTRLQGIHLQMEDRDHARLEGEVTVERNDKRLAADSAYFDRPLDQLTVEGNVNLSTMELGLLGDRAVIGLEEDRSQWQGVEFFFPRQHGYGRADEMEFTDPEHAYLKGVSYSTCPPQNRAWEITASTLSLDEATNTGIARNATVRFKGIPLFYSYHFEFPLKGRKTGLLAPTVGRSERNGTDASIPWYWNIAPHRDATITPRYISRRGSQLQGEFRYLNPTNAGSINYEWMPEDRLYERHARDYIRFSHAHKLGGWRTSLLYQEVSDPDYFVDLESSLVKSSQTNLKRQASASYLGEGWRLSLLTDDYQILSGSTPYRRAPQMVFEGSTPYRPNRLQFGLYGEQVQFRHPDNNLSAYRVDAKPSVALPFSGNAWFLTPRVAWRYTSYILSETDASYDDSTPSRELPITSLDGGLFFERDYLLAGHSLTHTIEPRLFYLNVPYQDQDNLPRFDTSSLTFSFPQLFRDNRFSGADRQGDADQLTVAVSSRIQDNQAGRELGRISLGQIRYLEQPQVTLTPSTPVETRNGSDWAAELAITPSDQFDLISAALWDPEERHTRESSLRAEWHPDEYRSISFGHRYRPARQEKQQDLLIFWPLSRQWRGVGRWYYDRVEERTLETVIGAEYQSCCWNLRLIGRSKPYYDADESAWKPDRSLYLTLELKGLGTIGRDLEDIIRDGILGYYTSD